MKLRFLPRFLSAINFRDRNLPTIDFIFRKVCIHDESGVGSQRIHVSQENSYCIPAFPNPSPRT